MLLRAQCAANLRVPCNYSRNWKYTMRSSQQCNGDEEHYVTGTVANQRHDVWLATPKLCTTLQTDTPGAALDAPEP